MKNIKYIIIAGLMILASSFVFAISVVRANEYRIRKASEYFASSKNTQDSHEKLFLLLKSNILAPSDEKKIEIAQIYLVKGDFAKAESYLNRVRGDSGKLIYAESLLEYGKFKEAKDKINEISDQKIRAELENIYLFLSDESKSNLFIDILTEQGTDLGKLIAQINKKDYRDILITGKLSAKLAQISKDSKGNVTRELNFANFLAENNQTIFARYILNQITSENPLLTDAFLVRAKTYNLEKNYQKALEEQLKAIRTKPDNILLYNIGLEYARSAGDTNEIQWLQDNITFLQKIQK